MEFLAAINEAKKEKVVIPSGLYKIEPTNKFSKDLAIYLSGVKSKKKELAKLYSVFDYLVQGMMPPKELNRPHKIGKLNSFPEYGEVWDIHVGSANSNWILLVNQDKETNTMFLLATGTHPYLHKVMHNGK